MWYLDVNSVKADFLILSSPFHIHSVLKLAPVLSQKSEKMHLVGTFCSSTAKTSTVTPIFYFMILIGTVLPFDEKKNLHKSMFSFLAILLNCTDWAITGRIACVQFNSALERKVKTRALEGIFLVRKWINNTFKSNSVPHASSKKISPFCLVLGCPRFCKRVLKSRICQHCDFKTSTVTPTFYYFFIIFLTCYISVPSFIYNLC